jgi:hypothetical protein
VPKRTGRQVFRVGLAVYRWHTDGRAAVCGPAAHERESVPHGQRAGGGSYQLSLHDSQPVLRSRVAAQVDHQWLRSSDYPRHQASQFTFEGDLGPGRAVTVICSGLDGKPDLFYVLQLYKQRPYGTVQVKVQNSVGREVTVQAIRSVEPWVSRPSIWVAVNRPTGFSPTVLSHSGEIGLLRADRGNRQITFHADALNRRAPSRRLTSRISSEELRRAYPKREGVLLC